MEDFDKYLKSKLSEKQYNSLHDKTFINTEWTESWANKTILKVEEELKIEREKHSKNKILHGLNVRYVNLETEEVTNITEEILNYDGE
jgi:serine/threonine protein phosphatase PrpC